jgi:penicillin amidase
MVLRSARVLIAGAILLWIVCRFLSAPHYPSTAPSAAVEIVRDEVGDPHVFASNRGDLYFGQGWATAADRIFQMDWMRRGLLGERAEIAGIDHLRADFEARALDLEHLARTIYERLPDEDRLALDAFAAGVNAWLGKNDLPREFDLLHYRPRAWRPWDAIVIGRGMALRLVELTDDLEREERERTGRTDPSYSGGSVDLSRGPVFLPSSTPRHASNAWAVASDASSTGRALLACDVHLDLTRPGPFCRIALSAPGVAATGFTVPGIPGVVCGRNRTVAWGVTAFCGDTADLFREALDASDPDRYRTPRGWARVEKRRPVVLVRLHRFLTLPIFWQAIERTRHGPVVRRTEEDLLALAWVGADPIEGERPFPTRIVRARTRAEVEAVLRDHGLPDLNVVVADTTGSVASYIAGSIPARVDHPGPRAGHDSTLAWHGTVAFEDLPHRIDPPEGFVVSANDSPAASPHYLGWKFYQKRYERIRDLLSAPRARDLGRMKVVQADVRVPGAEAGRRGILDSLETEDERVGSGSDGSGSSAGKPVGSGGGGGGREVLGILRDWDLRADEGSAGALVYRVLEAFGPGESNLRRAVVWLRDSWGEDPGRWAWGDFHRARLPHPLEDRDSSLALRPFPVDGDRYTVDEAWYPLPRWDKETPSARAGVTATFGPVFRFVTELGGTGAFEGTLLAGQSGDPDSPHATDRLDDWRHNRYRAFPPPGTRPPGARRSTVLRPED